MQFEVLDSALRLSIDSEALRSNWQTLDKLSGEARAGAAVKANGYGLGARKVVPILMEAGAKDFFVAHWREAQELVDLLSPSQLSVLHGPMNAADVSFAKAAGVKPVINSIAQAERWLLGGGGACDLMIDTGMNRLGVAISELSNHTIQSLDIDILLSHLASADEDTALNVLQLQRWSQARRQIAHKRGSLANSAGIFLGPEYHGDVTRPGIALYGGIPRSEMANAIQPVAIPEAAILQVRNIVAGDSVGYNATFTASRSMRVGTIALGYADGYLRCWSGKGILRKNGVALPVLGRVSMDLTVIDLSGAPSLGEGDWVQVDYTLPAASAHSGLSQYELLTLLGRRFSA